MSGKTFSWGKNVFVSFPWFNLDPGRYQGHRERLNEGEIQTESWIQDQSKEMRTARYFILSPEPGLQSTRVPAVALPWSGGNQRASGAGD